MKPLRFGLSLFMAVLFCILCSSSTAQYFTSKHFTRGADTAEIYLSCQWYIDQNSNTWKGIFHSFDNGQTLSVQRKMDLYTENGPIFGDSMPGALFQIPIHTMDTFGVSYDYGVTFENKYFNDIYGETAGCMAGELYIGGWGLFRGTDYGDTFTLQSTEDSMLLQEVGTQPGEVYLYKHPYYRYSDTLGLAISTDYGQTTTLNLINFPEISFFEECTVHRGTEPGEIYFAVRKNFDTIALFHSFDYGQTLEFKSYILFTKDEIWYTGGRTPGSFYYAERYICGYFDHSCIWINFSRDYGVTFTTYYHELDSTYTGIDQKKILPGVEVFPNPATERVIFRYGGTIPDGETQITIYDFFGKQVIEGLLLKGQSEITLDIRTLAPGLYCYGITQNLNRQTGKLVIVK